jgi:hypothetical protein
MLCVTLAQVFVIITEPQKQLALSDLEPLELKRLKFGSAYYFKLFNHLTLFDPNEAFLTFTPAALSRSNLPYLQKPIRVSN